MTIMPRDCRQYNTPLALRICERLELPEDVFRNCSHIEVVSNCCAMVEGCKSVTEYNDTVIKLNLGKNSVKFTGCDLTIKSLSLEQAMIEGKIISLEFGE